MPLTEDNLSVLAKKRVGVGPVPAVQGGAAYGADTGAATDAASVDVSEAILALVSVVSNGDLDIEVYGQRLASPTVDAFELVNGGESRTITDSGWSELVNVSTLGRLFIGGTLVTATNFTITIAPCLG